MRIKGVYYNNSYFKKGDIFIYTFALLLIISALIYSSAYASGKTNMTVVIEDDKGEIASYQIKGLNKEIEYTYEGENGEFCRIIIDSDGVFIEDANCPNRLCVSWGKITKPGEAILCLPHRIIVRIIGEGGVDDVVS